MGYLSKSSFITRNSLNYCGRAGAPKVTGDHAPAADAGLLCWYVHTLITQAARQSLDFSLLLLRALLAQADPPRTIFMTIVGRTLDLGPLLPPHSHTHLSLPECVAAFGSKIHVKLPNI